MCSVYDTWLKCWCRDYLEPTVCHAVPFPARTCAPFFLLHQHVLRQQPFKLWSWLSGPHLPRSVQGGDWRWWGENQRLTFLCHLTSQGAQSVLMLVQEACPPALSSTLDSPRGRTQHFFLDIFFSWYWLNIYTMINDLYVNSPKKRKKKKTLIVVVIDSHRQTVITFKLYL